MTYKLLDSGFTKKLEQVGDYKLIRPATTADWDPALTKEEWQAVDGEYLKENKNKGQWHWVNKNIPEKWSIDFAGINIIVKPTKTGQLGLFPEHLIITNKVIDFIEKSKPEVKILNLFAYTGIGSILMTKAGAVVCHVDSAREVINWGKENLSQNKNIPEKIRWISDDVMKFVKREAKRGNKYNCIIMDPPSFGRGPKGEIWDFTRYIDELLFYCNKILDKDKPSLCALSSHTPGYNNKELERLLVAHISFKGKFETESEKLFIDEENGRKFYNGYYAIVS